MESMKAREDGEGEAIMARLRERIPNLSNGDGDRIRLRSGKVWTSARSEARDRVFAEIRSHRRRVEVFILPPARFLRDPRRLARPAPQSQGWGWFRSRFDVTSSGQIESALRLLQQSYDYLSRRPNGRPRRGGRVGRRQTV